MIKRQLVFVFGAVVLLSVALTSSADAQSGFLAERSTTIVAPDPTSIPQFDPTLNNAQNSIISTVTITNDEVAAEDIGTDITRAFFTIEGLEHNRVSDLTVRVDYYPLGTNTSVASPTRTATLFERVGLTDNGSDAGNPADNGIIDNQNFDGFGALSNFDGAYRFENGGQSLFATATGLGDAATVPTLNSTSPGEPFYAASGANNGQVNLLQAFATDNSGNALQLPDIAGIYEFVISDRSNFLTNGTQSDNLNQIFTATNVTFQTAPVQLTPAIPEPGTASGMLLALIGLAARRRRA